jgi:hypothetical protein
VREARQEDHVPEQREEHPLSNHVVDALVAEHDESGYDAHAARTSGTPLVRWPLRANRMLTTPVRVQKSSHIGREVVARLLRLNDHRSAERERENASRRSGASHGHLATVVW